MTKAHNKQEEETIPTHTYSGHTVEIRPWSSSGQLLAPTYVQAVKGLIFVQVSIGQGLRRLPSLSGQTRGVMSEEQDSLLQTPPSF